MLLTTFCIIKNDQIISFTNIKEYFIIYGFMIIEYAYIKREFTHVTSGSLVRRKRLGTGD